MKLGFESLSGPPTKFVRKVFVDGVATCGKYTGESLEYLVYSRPQYIVTLYENHANSGVGIKHYKQALSCLAPCKEQEKSGRKAMPEGFWTND